MWDFPGGASGKKTSSTSAGDARGTGSIPGSGRSPGGGNGNPLQYSYLENPKDRGAWWATVHGATKSVTWPSNWKHNTHFMWRWTVFPRCLHTHSREMILPQVPSPLQGFPGGSVVKNLPVMQEKQVQSLGWEDPPGERRKWQPTPVFLPGKIPLDRGAWRGYSPWDHKRIRHDLAKQQLPHYTLLFPSTLSPNSESES